MTGLVANPDATVGCGGGPCGSIALPQDGGEDANPDATGPCGGGPCGSIVMPRDGGEDASDASHVLTGSIVMPHDGGEDAGILDATEDVTHCGGVCGVIVYPDP